MKWTPKYLTLDWRGSIHNMIVVADCLCIMANLHSTNFVQIICTKKCLANIIIYTTIGCSGYMSPEYALDGIFSIKSNVFSFGVVLLEIISGKKNTSFYQSKEAMSLLSYVSVLNSHNHLHSHHILFHYRLCRCVNFSNNLCFGNFLLHTNVCLLS